MTGFAVVTIDNRGSANRGMQFEAYVKVKYMYIHVCICTLNMSYGNYMYMYLSALSVFAFS